MDSLFLTAGMKTVLLDYGCLGNNSEVKEFVKAKVVSLFTSYQKNNAN
jgi:hypothetical protein